MEMRLAVAADLPRLKTMFGELVAHMDQTGVEIWDDIYPCVCFDDDIAHRRLYVMEEGEALCAAFALCETSDGAEQVTWANGGGKALYLDRLGVNVRSLRRGVGAATLREAQTRARALGAEYLRLFVVDINEPAIRLYRKTGFTQAEGVYLERIDEDLVLRELGFQRKL